ncbi:MULTISPECIES: response regulator transcription factor [Pseudomonas]|jgi:DNA-binding CsgD family transcriptional regulator|uniref:Response regulator transcription factor n=1 Tax=Pseudomonas qingdaonensis TaxID=2056231 RepID=A0ABX8DLN7_9PSED|nr:MULTISPECIES: LuxR C-terminal-related transcriptional regulator [Pseudomonas]KTC22635.1 hypothetical protein AO392_19550 [Pseudomonas putida]MCS5517073.1 LuxR C-terminal-related transcriptional regulator [Pseudomonas qingdaonensis]OOV93715.1 helix-turn-helix transcriptional regulator [Pseudomonas sp. MF6396]OUM26057.1 helix-turn-helix transcriptional regulator [Pseudomonas sp. 1239]PPS62598.1 DNA-binding response regulator [Pseudomonas sp. BRM28]
MSHTPLDSDHLDPSASPGDDRLTAREREALKHYAAGKNCKEVALALSISVNTVKFHTKNAVAKLGGKNRTAAVARAFALGLLS